MRIIYVRAAKSRGYIRIGVDTGEEQLSLVCSEGDYLSVGSPLTRDEIDENTLSVLLSSDMRYKARLHALRILSYADNNEKTLYRKLCLKGIDKEVASEVASEMVGLGYINEQRQLDRIIAEEVSRKLVGPKKLFPKLLAKGYARSDIEASIDRLECDGVIDFEASKRALLDKHKPKEPLEVKKLLYKNGYET